MTRERKLVVVAALCLCALLLLLAVPLPSPGQVTDIHGRPVTGARVEVDFLGASVASTTTGQGTYVLPEPHLPGLGSVAIAAPGYATVDAGAGSVALHRLSQVSGQILDDAGLPVAGATVTATSPGGLTHRAMTNDHGDYRFANGLPGGQTAFVVSAPDHQGATARRRLELDGSAIVGATLQRQFATLRLTTTPRGAKLSVDGQAIAGCAATPCTTQIPAGRHELELQAPLYVSWKQVVNTKPGQSISVTAKLQRETGVLSVSAPAEEISIDGTVVGTGSWQGEVSTGSHQVTARANGNWPTVQQVQVDYQQTKTIQLAATPVSTDPTQFQLQLQTYLQGMGGTYGVYLENLTSNQTLGLNPTASMEAASDIKMPTALYLLHQVDGGQIHLTDQVTLQQSDFMGGTGLLYYRAKVGDKYSYQDLLALLIQQSDNTAWQALDRQLGATQIDAFAASLGAPDCHQSTDQCTAQELGTLFSRLSHATAVSAASTTLLESLLETSAFSDRINYYLAGTTIAHHVGIDGRVMNDAGMVSSTHPFVLSMLTDCPDPDTGVQAIRDVARAAVTFEGG
ncbi:MAG: serine hydrolase [Candidatus Dormiibacterota bacterium]